MRKFFAITVGVMIGSSMAMMVSWNANTVATAAGVGNTFTTYDLFDWKDVFGIFGPSKSGQNLYRLVQDKSLKAPGLDARAQLAKNYGLSTRDIQSALNGSTAEILRAKSKKTVRFTQGDAFKFMEQIQDDYSELKELFDLQQEINIEVSPSEIFANGDLSDSGFDLVKDLELLEEILFIDQEDVTVGHTFDQYLKSPISPVKDEDKQDDILAGEELDERRKASTGKVFGGLDLDDDDDDEDSDLVFLDEDICVENYDDDFGVIEFKDFAEVIGGDVGAGSGAGGFGKEGGDSESVLGPDGRILAAESGEWGGEWCPGLDTGAGVSGSGGNHGEFAGAGFKSLGNKFGSYESLKELVDGGAAAAGAGFEAPGIEANFGICFSSELIWKTVSSYLPGDSCVLCEVEEINDLLGKTLKHSLIYNKAAGNLMESAKCKDAFEIPGIDMKFIALSAPVQTPPNNDLVFGSNIFVEWNKFVDSYSPLLFENHDVNTKFISRNSSNNATQNQVMRELENLENKSTAEATRELEVRDLSPKGTNLIQYSNTVLKEIGVMHSIFKDMQRLFIDIDEKSCRNILDKKTIG